MHRNKTGLQVHYRSSGRPFLVATGTLTFVITTAGMWLFTIANPYFFWFGAPTVFLMIYFVFHCEHAKSTEWAGGQAHTNAPPD